MNYIHQLQAENAALRAKLAEIEQMAQGQIARLHTDKFKWPEDYIRVNDMLPALRDIRSAAQEGQGL